ncbi:MAG: hypothetical protein AN487_12310 [Anabaena sp. CRKS33]|jgi:peroxiredoxin|nr:MAG: hypothetical protein AN487_12310 [Anabaena sp. CRKS33]
MKYNNNQLVNQFFKCVGFIKLSATEITVSTISVVVGAKVSKKDLSCDHHNSIGLKSGEDGDKQITVTPTDSIIGTIDASFCRCSVNSFERCNYRKKFIDRGWFCSH